MVAGGSLAFFAVMFSLGRSMGAKSAIDAGTLIANGFGANLVDGQVSIAHGVVKNTFPRRDGEDSGWLPALIIRTEGGFRSEGYTWLDTRFSKKEAEKLAHRDAHDEASKYIGDWDIEIVPMK